MPRTILIHLNVELPNDDTRTVEEIVESVVGQETSQMAVALAEEV